MRALSGFIGFKGSVGWLLSQRLNSVAQPCHAVETGSLECARGGWNLGCSGERADYVGMMATIMNSLVLRDTFLRLGMEVYNQSGLGVDIIDKIDPIKSKQAIQEGKIVIFGGGTGKPFFSTDTGASLRAIDIGANVIVKLTNVDGVYDKDPHKFEDAKRYEKVSYDEVLEKQLGVMDLEAIEMCKENNIEIVVTNINDSECLNDVINDGNKGTKVVKE